jgi:hypothetical protein
MRKFPYFPLIICQQVKGTARVKNLGVERNSLFTTPPPQEMGKFPYFPLSFLDCWKNPKQAQR